MRHERRAFICTAKECVPPFRTFLQPDEPASAASCPQHGTRSMQRQTNVPYKRPNPDLAEPVGKGRKIASPKGAKR
jgi:hypothetical protein